MQGGWGGAEGEGEGEGEREGEGESERERESVVLLPTLRFVTHVNESSHTYE